MELWQSCWSLKIENRLALLGSLCGMWYRMKQLLQGCQRLCRSCDVPYPQSILSFTNLICPVSSLHQILEVSSQLLEETFLITLLKGWHDTVACKCLKPSEFLFSALISPKTMCLSWRNRNNYNFLENKLHSRHQWLQVTTKALLLQQKLYWNRRFVCSEHNAFKWVWRCGFELLWQKLLQPRRVSKHNTESSFR